MYSIVHYPHHGWVDGIVINLSDVSFILLFAYLIVKRKHRWTAPAAIVLPAFSFAGAVALSMINSTMHAVTLFLVIMIVKSFILYYFVFLNAIESEKDVKRILVYLSISLGIQAVLGCAESLFGIDTNFLRSDLYQPEKMSMASGHVRGTGTFGSPNALAGYIVPLLLLNISLLLKVPAEMVFRTVIILVSIVALIFTGSRNGWISFGAILAVFLIHTLRYGLVARKYMGILAIGFAVTLVLSYPVVRDRITRSDHGSSAVRIPLMKLAWNMVEAHPIVGVGGNTFANVANGYISMDLQGMFVTIVHNQYLLVFSECGIIGLLTFLWLLWAGLRDACLCAKAPSSRLSRAVGSGLLFAFASILISMLFDMFKAHYSINNFFVLLALSSYGGRYFRPGPSSLQGDLGKKKNGYV